jgi:hypothetical protein
VLQFRKALMSQRIWPVDRESIQRISLPVIGLDEIQQLLGQLLSG